VIDLLGEHPFQRDQAYAAEGDAGNFDRDVRAVLPLAAEGLIQTR
jgi:hypothetical protein